MSWSLFLSKNWRTLDALKINFRNLNTVKFHSRESFSHRMTKCILCHLLWEKGHYFATEQPINDSICDVIDLNTFVIYEIEAQAIPSGIKKKLDDFRHPLIEDLVIVDLRKMDMDWVPVLEVSDDIKKVCGLKYKDNPF